MPVIQTRNKSTGSRKNIFSEEQFAYDEKTNTLICPAGKRLKRESIPSKPANHRIYGEAGKSVNCELRAQCTE